MDRWVNLNLHFSINVTEPLILTWKVHWWWKRITREKRLQAWECTMPQLVLYLNIAHRCHKYFEAITTVTHHLKLLNLKLLHFKGFFIANTSKKVVVKASNFFWRDVWVSKLNFRLNFWCWDPVAEKSLELCLKWNILNWKERY